MRAEKCRSGLRVSICGAERAVFSGGNKINELYVLSVSSQIALENSNHSAKLKNITVQIFLHPNHSNSDTNVHHRFS